MPNGNLRRSVKQDAFVCIAKQGSPYERGMPAAACSPSPQRSLGRRAEPGSRKRAEAATGASSLPQQLRAQQLRIRRARVLSGAAARPHSLSVTPPKKLCTRLSAATRKSGNCTSRSLCCAEGTRFSPQSMYVANVAKFEPLRLGIKRSLNSTREESPGPPARCGPSGELPGWAPSSMAPKYNLVRQEAALQLSSISKYSG